ncbi:MAG: hypothetical protein EB015_07585 [Methylocystaceae bacterium]|nr:hypothetical protein [Methylocystaceae bacterium]
MKAAKATKRSRVFFGLVEDVFLAKIMRLTKIWGTAPPYKAESAAFDRPPPKSAVHDGLELRMPHKRRRPIKKPATSCRL